MKRQKDFIEFDELTEMSALMWHLNNLHLTSKSDYELLKDRCIIYEQKNVIDSRDILGDKKYPGKIHIVECLNSYYDNLLKEKPKTYYRFKNKWKGIC